MPTGCRSFDEFLAEYNLPEKPDRDFEIAGVPAHYALGHPREWDPTNDYIDYGKVLKGDSEGRDTFCSALSPDGKLLAISSESGRIAVYDVASKELRQLLDGNGSIAFRPFPSTNGLAEDAVTLPGAPAYTLVSSIKNDDPRGFGEPKKLTLWEMDHNGRLLDEEEPIDPSGLAEKAIDAILPDLQAKHEWHEEFVATSSLHTDFAKALSQVAAEHRRRHNTIIENAHLGGFGSKPFSHNGKWLLYAREENTSSFAKNKTPQVIVYDIEAGEEVYYLSGHTDNIMWFGFSPNDQYIASVSWDGTMRMYSTEYGELEWVTKDSGGQSWTGAFSADSKYIAWSGERGSWIQVHNVADGKVLSDFKEKMQEWCRCLSWDADSQRIALCAGRDVYVWRPFQIPERRIEQHYQLDNDGGWCFSSIEKVSWMDNGRYLALQTNEGSKIFYNPFTNAKEVFKRPGGLMISWVYDGFYGFFGQEGDEDFFLTVDGDGKARYWQMSVPAGTSWWEKDGVETLTKKLTSLRTGKYVKVTMPGKSEKKEQIKESEGWIEKGAELWTAE